MSGPSSSYTASPGRYRSPQHSPARHPASEDGSHYEVDLDALGLNSTFDDSTLEQEHAPKVDVVDTSDIGGPEDFTMNMTYWMTADLPLSQIKSRKEANSRIPEVRGDARESADAHDETENMDEAVIEDTVRDRVISDDASASPTARPNGPRDQNKDESALFEPSMENDEKVMSYLSALPDTDLPGAITSTPLKVKGPMLQVPSPAVSRARSMQPTVEDYETPRKPTQETVIHHVQPPTPPPHDPNYTVEALREQMAELQSRLEQQELTSKTRITELETILSYTRSELDAARTQIYKQKEEIAQVKSENEQRKHEQKLGDAEVAVQIREKERELEARMQEFTEELHLQNAVKMQDQREDFEKQLKASEAARKSAEEEAHSKEQLLAQLRDDLADKHKYGEREQEAMDSANDEHQKQKQEFAQERDSMNKRLSALQSRAQELEAHLAKATADAQAAREEVEAARAEARAPPSYHSPEPSSEGTYTLRISDLESLNRSLKSQLESLRVDLSAKDQQLLHNIQSQDGLEQRLSAAEGRNEGLQTTISTLRQQLADAHRESAKARTDAERYEEDLEEWRERLEEARIEADRRVADVEKKLSKMKESKADAEARFRELQSEHESLLDDHQLELEDVRSKAEDAVRKVGALLEAERNEKRRIAKELKRAREQVNKLREEVAKKEDESESEDETSMISSQSDSKDAEIQALRALVKNQASTMKTLKAETASLRKKTSSQPELEALRDENRDLKSTITNLNSTIRNLNSTVSSLQQESETQRADFEAINRSMDERLATMLSKLIKERSKVVAGKRDDHWLENVGRLKTEKEFMGRVLMREWGRQECGAITEEHERQPYRYQYVRRS